MNPFLDLVDLGLAYAWLGGALAAAIFALPAELMARPQRCRLIAGDAAAGQHLLRSALPPQILAL